MPADDPLMKTTEHPPEPTICEHFQRAVEVVARRWNPLIVSALLDGVARYTDLRNAVPGISDRLLSERLKELEAAGIVTREVTPCTPVKIEYGLTPAGRDLGPVLGELRSWAERWADVPAPLP